ncbi:hypothetical protein BT69DRAFT_1335229 [Atractiella rhizophila]|nr:hypothetical protein BT69DRAFT_1335229 [Atractiella rhizophila]
MDEPDNPLQVFPPQLLDQLVLEKNAMSMEPNLPPSSDSGPGAPPTFLPFTPDLYVSLLRPVVVGALINFTLFGITILQFNNVFRLLRNQENRSKLTWFLLLVLLGANLGETVSKALNLSALVSGAAEKGVLIFLGDAPPSAICVRRILNLVRRSQMGGKQLGGNLLGTYIALAIAPMFSITGLVGAVWTCIIVLDRPIPEWIPVLYLPSSFWLGGAAVADVLLCGIFTYYLLKNRRISSYGQTREMVNRWIRLTFETSLTPSILQLIHLAIWFGDIKHGYHYSVAFFIPKIYVVSVLVLYEEAMGSSSSASAGSNGGTGSGGSGRYVARKGANGTGAMEHKVGMGGVLVSTNTFSRAESRSFPDLEAIKLHIANNGRGGECRFAAPGGRGGEDRSIASASVPSENDVREVMVHLEKAV